MKKDEIIKLNAIIKAAAEQAYKNEVVGTYMEEYIIGNDKEYTSKEDWIDWKINEWEELSKLIKE